MNIASRMEKAGVPDKINVSEDTAEEVRDFFTCEYRGIQEIKNIGPKGMHFLNRISPELSDDEQGYFPNKRFNELYCEKFVGRARTKEPRCSSRIHAQLSENERWRSPMTEDKRVYPRIDSEWPLFLEREGARRQIGRVKNISLSGAHLIVHGRIRAE